MDAYLPLLTQALAIGLLTGALYVLVALGLTLIYGILHIVNFAHGEIYMLGAMAVFYLHVVFRLPFALTLASILVLSLVFGLVVERFVFRSLRGQWLQLLVASLGISLGIQSIGWIPFGIQEQNVPPPLPPLVPPRPPPDRPCPAAVRAAARGSRGGRAGGGPLLAGLSDQDRTRDACHRGRRGDGADAGRQRESRRGGERRARVPPGRGGGR